MSTRSLTYQQSVFKGYHCVTNISQSFAYKMAAKINWQVADMEQNYVTVALCVLDFATYRHHHVIHYIPVEQNKLRHTHTHTHTHTRLTALFPGLPG